MGRATTRSHQNGLQSPALRVLIAPDKFKGTLTAEQAAQAIADGWSCIRPEDELDLLPITDGGDGFGLAMAGLLEARHRKIQSVDPAGRQHTGSYFWHSDTRTAVIESAAIVGLALLPHREFHPFDLDTFGLGKVFRTVHRLAPRTCFVGVGGSATNDGGFGLARSLGWKFLDSQLQEITKWPKLSKLRSIQRPDKPLEFAHLLVAVDVQNTLLGACGASHVYGPQKGLRPRDFPRAEAALKRLAKVTADEIGFNCAALPGSGAAGGLGFGLAAFCGGKLVPGFQLFAERAQLAKKLGAADLIVTGEGLIDRSTFMGKGVGELAKVCHKLNVPCFAIGGQINLSGSWNHLLRQTVSLCSLTALANAQQHPINWVKKAAERLASLDV